MEEPGYDEPEYQVEGLGFVLSPGMRSDLATWTDLCACGEREEESSKWAGIREKAGGGSRAARDHGSWARQWLWERRAMS